MSTTREMTRELVMADNDMSDEEFDALYELILTQIRNFGTHGLREMMQFVEQELIEGREDI